VGPTGYSRFGIRGHHGDFVYDLPLAAQALQINLFQFNLWIFGGTILLGWCFLATTDPTYPVARVGSDAAPVIFPLDLFFLLGGPITLLRAGEALCILAPIITFLVWCRWFILGAQAMAKSF